MMRAPTRVVLAALAGMTISMPMLATPATAKILERGEFRDPFSQTLTNFCGATGLTIQVDGVIEASFVVNSRGRDKVPYFMQRGVVRRTLTNEATGASVTELSRTLEKDLKITDNGDGTLTILVLATGNATVAGADGKAIARNPGQVRFELLVDHGGTPTDPSDDETIEFLGEVKPSTGRSDDFCAAVVPALS